VRHYREALRIAPDLADVHQQLGRTLHAAGRHAEALPEFREAMRLEPGWAAPLADAALLLAAQPDAAARDPGEAVRLARRAAELTGFKNADVLQVLGAACAAAKQFDEAVEAQGKAVKLLASSDAGASADAERTLESYRRHEGPHQ
jgi:tetratricopeptide (TPR) repeat protein